MNQNQQEEVILASKQPGLIDTSSKRLVKKEVKTFTTGQTQQPVVTRRIHRKFVPMDGILDIYKQDTEEVVQQPIIQQPQPVIHPVQQMIWPVAVQFNEDDALSKIREEKILGLMERQADLLSHLLQKYKRLEEDQNNKIQRRIKELERENEDIWQRRRQNFLIYNVAQSVDSKLREFNNHQMRPFLDQGQPVILKPMHIDDKRFFGKGHKKKPKKVKEVDDGLVEDPETGDLWDPRTGEVVQPGFK